MREDLARIDMAARGMRIAFASPARLARFDRSCGLG